jgi:hypothetical protein
MSAKKLELKNIQEQIDLGQFHNLTTKRQMNSGLEFTLNSKDKPSIESPSFK